MEKTEPWQQWDMMYLLVHWPQRSCLTKYQQLHSNKTKAPPHVFSFLTIVKGCGVYFLFSDKPRQHSDPVPDATNGLRSKWHNDIYMNVWNYHIRITFFTDRAQILIHFFLSQKGTTMSTPWFISSCGEAAAPGKVKYCRQAVGPLASLLINLTISRTQKHSNSRQND